MIRALVVDDELLARQYLRELLEAEGVAVVADVATAAEADRALSAQPIDVAFVDVRLVENSRDRSGLDWVVRLVDDPRAPAIVLATALAEHALAAFDAGAVDYLLKPFTPERVATCVGRLQPRSVDPRVRAGGGRLVARTHAGIVFLNVDGVLAFEAAERLTYVHHGRERYMIDPSLASLEARYAGETARTHRNWLVAIAQVRELLRADGELVLRVGDAGLIVPVARDRAAGVRAALLRASH